MLVKRSDVAARSVFDVWPCTSEREIDINLIKNAKAGTRRHGF